MKKIIAKITLFITLMFDKTFAFLAKNSMVAVSVTDMLKKAVESPVADVITALIPGDVDDRIVSSLRANLPKVLFKMALIHRISTESSTNSESVPVPASICRAPARPSSSESTAPRVTTSSPAPVETVVLVPIAVDWMPTESPPAPVLSVSCSIPL